MKKSLSTFILASVAFLSSAAVTVDGQATTLPFAIDGEKLPTLADVVEKIEHGIVNISTATNNRRGLRNYSLEDLQEFFQSDEFFQPFFRFDNPGDRRRPRPGLNLGSGVIIDAARGYILTNNHLLTDASEVQVTLLDGRTADAEIIGADPDMDLALLKVNLPGLTAVKMGNSDALRVGDFVLALGNNFGLSATVTSGIVSALGRSGLGLEQYEEYIQTDAAINPGSSGGALVNLRGEVIGINTAILSPAGGNVGIAFAIPVNTAASVVEQIIEYGRVRRGILGIHFQELTQDMAQAFGLEQIEGVLINQILPGSAADQAGMKEGDVLIGVNGSRVLDGSQLRTTIALIRVGELVEVEYVRDGEVMLGSGRIGDRARQIVHGEDIAERLDSVVFENLQRPDQGVLVASVERGSHAWRSGIREGDVVVEVNQQKINDVQGFSQAIGDPDDLILLRINRQDETYFIAMH